MSERGERADAARNRRAILAAAYRLICERGVSSVSMDDIAAEAGVGKGTLFRRFGDREGLVGALLEHLTDAWQREALARAGDDRVPAITRAVAFATELFEVLVVRGRPLLRALERAPTGGYCTDGYEQWHRQLATLIGQARPDADADYLAYTVLATMRGELVDHLTERCGMTMARVRSGVIAHTYAVVSGSAPPEDLVPPPARCDDAG
jgi:AcrR family transcriptional regulator